MKNTTVKTAEELLGLWTDINVLLITMEEDLNKSLFKNNLSAGRRSRSTLRYVKKLVSSLNDDLMLFEKTYKEKEK